MQQVDQGTKRLPKTGNNSTWARRMARSFWYSIFQFLLGPFRRLRTQSGDRREKETHFFIVEQVRGFCTGTQCNADGTDKEIKPEWGKKWYDHGKKDLIRIALSVMTAFAADVQ